MISATEEYWLWNHVFYCLLRNKLDLNINFEDWIRISSVSTLQQFHFCSWRWLQRVLEVIKPSLASDMEIYGELYKSEGMLYIADTLHFSDGLQHRYIRAGDSTLYVLPVQDLWVDAPMLFISFSFE